MKDLVKPGELIAPLSIESEFAFLSDSMEKISCKAGEIKCIPGGSFTEPAE